MQKRELKNFYNRGFGWVCRHCQPEPVNTGQERSRLMSEGEAENGKPEFSTKGLARWTDTDRRTLICPQCGISEKL